MRPEEITVLRYAGFTEKEIRNFRKVCRGKRYLTSNNTSQPDFIQLELPPEARYLFGIAKCANLKVDFTFNLILNNEYVVQDANIQICRFDGGIAIGDGCNTGEYLTVGRRLTGRDSLVFNINYGATVSDHIIWYFVVDERAMPREGNVVQVQK